MGRDSLFLALLFAKCLIIQVNSFLASCELCEKNFPCPRQTQLPPRNIHTKIECSGSLTCVSQFCFLSNYENYVSTVNMGCLLVRPLTKFYVSGIDIDCNVRKPTFSIPGSTSDKATLRMVAELSSHHRVTTLRVVSNYAWCRPQSHVQTLRRSCQQLDAWSLASMSVLGDYLFTLSSIFIISM